MRNQQVTAPKRSGPARSIDEIDRQAWAEAGALSRMRGLTPSRRTRTDADATAKAFDKLARLRPAA